MTVRLQLPINSAFASDCWLRLSLSYVALLGGQLGLLSFALALSVHVQYEDHKKPKCC
jgi:hypothetical protein